MKTNYPSNAAFWNQFADRFDTIYTGKDKPFLARAADRLLRKDMYQRFDWVMQKSGNVRGKEICDIGCGTGRFATELARRGAAHVTGIDIAPNMLKLARQLAAETGVSSACNFVLTDMKNWETADVFDQTVAIGFWDYIADPPPLLRRIRQITRPSGKLLCAWPRLWTWRMPIRKVRLGLKGCPVYFYRKAQVYTFMEGAGFRIKTFDVIGKLFCVEAEAV